jgi:WD40 repeat protein
VKVWNVDAKTQKLTLIDTLSDVSDHVSSVAFSPDSSQLAAGSAAHGLVYIWNVDSSPISKSQQLKISGDLSVAF